MVLKDSGIWINNTNSGKGILIFIDNVPHTTSWKALSMLKEKKLLGVQLSIIESENKNSKKAKKDKEA